MKDKTYIIEDVNAIFEDGDDLFVLIGGNQHIIQKSKIDRDSEIQHHGDFGKLVIDEDYAEDLGLTSL